MKMGNKVMWKSIVQLKFTEDDPKILCFKYDYEEDYRKCKFRNEGPGTRNKTSNAITVMFRK